MYIQHRFSKHCTRAKPFDFFHLFLALSLPPEGMCFSPPEKQTSTRSARVGGGKHIPGCSSSLKPQMPPNPVILPVLCTSAQHPGLVMQPREELDRVHSRVLNLISFPLWFQEAKHEGEVQPVCASTARQWGSAQAPLCSSPFQTKCCRADVAAKVNPEGAELMHPNPQGTCQSLGTQPWHEGMVHIQVYDIRPRVCCKCRQIPCGVFSPVHRLVEPEQKGNPGSRAQVQAAARRGCGQITAGCCEG